MKKYSKTFVMAILCYSMTIATPLFAQNDDTSARAYQTADRDDDDDAGDWGLAGLLGLLGLLGLRRRDYDRRRDDDNRARPTRNP